MLSSSCSDYRSSMRNKSTRFYQCAELIPYFADIKAIVRECLQMGFAPNLIKTIACFKKVSFSGSLYSKQHNRKFDTEQSVAYIKNVVRPEQKNKWQLFIDDLPVVDWFKMKYEQWREKAELVYKEKARKRGIKI
jgi:mobilization protein